MELLDFVIEDIQGGVAGQSREQGEAEKEKEKQQQADGCSLALCRAGARRRARGFRPGDERLLGDMVCTATVAGTSVDVDTSITTGKGGIFGKGDMQINIKGYVFGKNIADEIIKQSKGKQVEVTKVDCPPVTKLEAGKTFKCTATANNIEVPIEITMNETGWNSRIVGDGPAPSDLPMVPDPAAPAAPDPTTLGPQ